MATLFPNLSAARKSKKKDIQRRKGLRGLALQALMELRREIPMDPAAGKYGIVRIVCGFPVRVDLPKVFMEPSEEKRNQPKKKKSRLELNDPDNESHPLGKFNEATLIDQTKNSSPTDILETIRECGRRLQRKKQLYYASRRKDCAILGIEQKETHTNEVISLRRINLRTPTSVSGDTYRTSTGRGHLKRGTREVEEADDRCEEDD